MRQLLLFLTIISVVVACAQRKTVRKKIDENVTTKTIYVKETPTESSPAVAAQIDEGCQDRPIEIICGEKIVNNVITGEKVFANTCSLDKERYRIKNLGPCEDTSPTCGTKVGIVCGQEFIDCAGDLNVHPACLSEKQIIPTGKMKSFPDLCGLEKENYQYVSMGSCGSNSDEDSNDSSYSYPESNTNNSESNSYYTPDITYYEGKICAETELDCSKVFPHPACLDRFGFVFHKKTFDSKKEFEDSEGYDLLYKGTCL